MICAVVLAYFIYTIESEKRVVNEDLIELSKVKYGLFSVDEWEEILSEIITKRINDFDLEDTNKERMREKIADFLKVAIEELKVAYNEEEGLLKRVGASVFDVFGHMEKKIPEITESIMTFMNDPENREQVKEYLLKKMNEYSETTFSEIDYTTYQRILMEHEASEKQEAIRTIKSKIERLENRQKSFSIPLFTLIIILGIGIILSRNIQSIEFALLTLICVVFLAIGVSLPMINIDARVSEISFRLLGESIVFTDQVLYFKSKSIFEVVTLMISNKKIEVALVGFLVLLFSILFPVSKLMASLVYIYSEKMKNSKVVQFFVFKTAKWSMADVMVVAIFMAFIGFSGIVSQQLKDLEGISTSIDMMTTNASMLQIGFFLFTSFVVLSLLVSYKLQYQIKN